VVTCSENVAAIARMMKNITVFKNNMPKMMSQRLVFRTEFVVPAGQVAFFTSDGGTTELPLDGVLTVAKILRVKF